MPFVNERLDDGNWQTIDRENDIALIRAGGPDQAGRYIGEMMYKKEKVIFHAICEHKIIGTPKLGEKKVFDIQWMIYGLYMPHELRPQEDMIKQSLEEALTTRGWHAVQERTNTVEVIYRLTL